MASLKIPNLSWLAAYGGFVWVKRDDGFVDRIDARTNRSTGRVGRFTGQDDYCQGIGAGGGAVWSCTKSAITRIDPKRMKIVARIPAGKVFDQGRLVFAQGRLWIIGGANGDELRGIDPVGNKLGPPIKLGSTCSDLAQAPHVRCGFSAILEQAAQGRRETATCRWHGVAAGTKCGLRNRNGRLG